VGQYSPQGDSPYGCADMAGNVLEWTRSLYEGYPYDPSDGRENLEASRRVLPVLRGGGFGNDVSNVRCAARGRWVSPDGWNGDIGFRLVVACMPG